MEISRHGRVDDLGKLLLGVQPSERSSSRKPTSAETPGTDRVEISEAAKEMQRVRDLTETGAAARADRVETLKQAVESGTYTVSGRKIADGLLRHTLIEGVL